MRVFHEQPSMPASAAAIASTGPDIPAAPAAPSHPAHPSHPRPAPRPLRALLRALVEFARAWAWLFNLLQTQNILYSIKTFAAGMLAMFIAFKLDLTEPRWALMAVYIVSLPSYSGMVLSRSIARVCGTLVGTLAAVVLVALFHNVPPLFVMAIALWIGFCLYCSIYMREAPGSYGAMLSGYTAAIIGFSAISAPDTIFETASGRCLETILGICVATLASRVVLPRTSGRVFRIRVAGTLADMNRVIKDILGGHYDDARGLADLKKLLANSLALETLRIHASRDTAGVREAGDLVRAIQGRVLSILSMLVSLHDRLLQLRKQRPETAARLDPLFARVAQRIETISAAARPAPAVLAGASAGISASAAIQRLRLTVPGSGNAGVPPADEARPDPRPAPSAAAPPAAAPAPSLTGELLARLPDFDAVKRDRELILEYNILIRLVDILAQWQEVNRLGALLFSDNAAAAPNLPAPPPEDTQITNYRDHSLARVSTIGAIIAVVGVTLFWMWTAWPNGASAATFAGVLSCTTAVQDDPARRALRTLGGCLIAALWSMVYLYAILPRLSNFGELVAVLALVYVPAGVLIPNPRYGTIVYVALVYGATFMGLRNDMEPDFAGTLNGDIALIIGIIAAMIGFRLLRPGADWALRRHTTGMFRDIANLATMTGPINRALFETRMLDRINAIMLRLPMNNAADHDHLRAVFTATRIGLNIRNLARWHPAMPPALAAPVRDALDTLADHCRHLARHPDAAPPQTPLPALDRAIQQALDTGAAATDETFNTLVSLSAIRATLLQHEKFYRIQPQTPAAEIPNPKIPNPK